MKQDVKIYENYSPNQKEAAITKRMRKWLRNNSGILEIFAATGTLKEFSKVHPAKDIYDWWWKMSRDNIPSFTPYVLELSLNVRGRILSEMKTLLGVSVLQPAIPMSLLQNLDQIKWISAPNRYRMSVKSKGM